RAIELTETCQCDVARWLARAQGRGVVAGDVDRRLTRAIGVAALLTQAAVGRPATTTATAADDGATQGHERQERPALAAPNERFPNACHSVLRRLLPHVS